MSLFFTPPPSKSTAIYSQICYLNESQKLLIEIQILQSLQRFKSAGPVHSKLRLHFTICTWRKSTRNLQLCHWLQTMFKDSTKGFHKMLIDNSRNITTVYTKQQNHEVFRLHKISNIPRSLKIYHKISTETLRKPCSLD